MLKYKRILVTGAAGQLGQLARKALRNQVAYLRLNDIAAMAPAAGNEELWSCDLADAQSVGRMLQDVDAVIHLGASLNVDDWHDTLQVNIAGAYHIYESARQAGVKRVIYASRSEEHTSELQYLMRISYAVFCLKKKNTLK